MSTNPLKISKEMSDRLKKLLSSPVAVDGGQPDFSGSDFFFRFVKVTAELTSSPYTYSCVSTVFDPVSATWTDGAETNLICQSTDSTALTIDSRPIVQLWGYDNNSNAIYVCEPVPTATIPDATPSVSGQVNTTSQALGGIKAITNNFVITANGSYNTSSPSTSYGPGYYFEPGSGKFTYTNSDGSLVTEYLAGIGSGTGWEINSIMGSDTVGAFCNGTAPFAFTIFSITSGSGYNTAAYAVMDTSGTPQVGITGIYSNPTSITVTGGIITAIS